jgi:hypothetical protein
MGPPQLFNLNHADNVAAWYSSVVCLTIVGALTVIAAAKRQARDLYWPHWAVLAVVFLCLSFDDRTHVHDNLADVANGFTFFADAGFVPRALSAVVAGSASLLVAFSGVRFLRHLPSPTRTLFATSGVAFLGAAIGLEMLNPDRATGTYTPASMIFSTVEEGIEMGSFIMFLYALLTYVERTFGQARMSFGDGPMATEPVSSSPPVQLSR